MTRRTGTSCDELKDLDGWKSKNRIDRYAKFATENLAFTAFRIEPTRDRKVIPLSRYCHVMNADDTGKSDKALI